MALVEMKTTKITKKGQIAIPKDIRELEGFEEGDKVAILAFEDRVELRPLKQFSERMFTALASERTLAKDWLSKEEEQAWRNFKRKCCGSTISFFKFKRFKKKAGSYSCNASG